MSSKRLTSLKFNSSLSPDKCWWEDYFPFLLGLRPIFRSHVKLREGIFFFGFLRLPHFLWGDFYTSWASPGWRRHHLCITRGDQEDCNLSSVSEMGEVGVQRVGETPGLGGSGWVGLRNHFLQKQTSVFFLKKTAKNQWANEMRGLLFLWGMSETFATFFWRQRMGVYCETVVTFFPNFWSLDSRRFGHVFKQCIWQELFSQNFPTTPRGLPVWTLS